MKRKDIALFIVIGVISAIFSIIISRYFFATPASKKQTAEVVQPITTEFSEPNKKYFNKEAFDPTRQITIGETVNTDPFKGPGN